MWINPETLVKTDVFLISFFFYFHRMKRAQLQFYLDSYSIPFKKYIIIFNRILIDLIVSFSL